MFFTTNYADFKLVAGQFTSGHVFFSSGTNSFKIWGMSSGFPVLVCGLTSQPSTFNTDFPSAISLTNGLMTEIG